VSVRTVFVLAALAACGGQAPLADVIHAPAPRVEAQTPVRDVAVETPVAERYEIAAEIIASFDDARLDAELAKLRVEEKMLEAERRALRAEARPDFVAARARLWAQLSQRQPRPAQGCIWTISPEGSTRAMLAVNEARFAKTKARRTEFEEQRARATTVRVAATGGVRLPSAHGGQP
jgi:hypothetical protein